MTNKKSVNKYKFVHDRSRNTSVGQHVVIAEKMIGRKLKNNECVHHINGIKSDNRYENLKVMTRRAHLVFHNKGKKYPNRKPTRTSQWVFRRGLIMDLRKSQGWSMRMLAERAGTSVQTIWRAEHDIGCPIPKIIHKLAVAFGKQPSELLQKTQK